MTDTTVEEFLITQFETIGTPLLTSKITNGKTTYTNVAYENKSFTRPSDNYWFELFFIPSRPYQQELGQSGRNRWQGVFQINICVPKNVGKTSINARFNSIVNAFPRGYITDGIRITSAGRTSARTADDYCFQPVSVYWEADLDI